MCTYLKRRGAIYYTRRIVPKHLQPILGKTDLGRSLGTSDRDEAKRLWRVWLGEVEAELDAAKREYARQQGEAVEAPPAPPTFDPFAGMSQDDFEGWQQQDREALAEMIAEDDRMEEAEAWAASLPSDHPARLLIGEERDRAGRYRLDAHKYRKRRRASLAAGASQSVELPPAQHGQPSSAISPQGGAAGNLEAVSLTSLFDAYAEKRLSAAIKVEWRKAIADFVAFVGHDNARSMTKEDVKRWRDHVAAVPKKNGQPRSPQRVNAGYLAPLRAAFKHGVKETLLEHNPAVVVGKLLEEKKAEARDRLFMRDEWKAILSASLKAETGDAGSRYRQLARRWVPWLCAYSGARVNEITGLRAEDVQQVEGYWIMKVSRSKTRSFSNVPIHEHLIEQGFLAFVKAQGEGPLFFDPERGDPNKVRGQHVKVGQRLAMWVRGLGIDDPDVMPNHAWRHTFTSYAMEAGMDERASNYITGHAQVGVSRTRYTHQSHRLLAQQMALFPRYILMNDK